MRTEKLAEGGCTIYSSYQNRKNMNLIHQHCDRARKQAIFLLFFEIGDMYIHQHQGDTDVQYLQLQKAFFISQEFKNTIGILCILEADSFRS